MQEEATGRSSRLRQQWPPTLAFALLAVVLVFLTDGFGMRLRSAGAACVHPFSVFSDAVVRAWHAAWCRDSVYEITAERALELMVKNARLRGSAQAAAAMRARLRFVQRRLSRLYAPTDSLILLAEHKLISARVVRIKGKQAFYQDCVHLDRGTDDGVQRNHLVVNADLSLIGKVEVAGADWCFMRPSTSPRFSVSVKVPRRNVAGMLAGGSVFPPGGPGAEEAPDAVTPELRHVRVCPPLGPLSTPSPTYLEPGDVVVTSSTGDPERIGDEVFAGVVTEVAHDPAGLPVKASMRMARLAGDEVLFVVLPRRGDRPVTVSLRDVEEAAR